MTAKRKLRIHNLIFLGFYLLFPVYIFIALSSDYEGFRMPDLESFLQKIIPSLISWLLLIGYLKHKKNLNTLARRMMFGIHVLYHAVILLFFYLFILDDCYCTDETSFTPLYFGGLGLIISVVDILMNEKNTNVKAP